MFENPKKTALVCLAGLMGVEIVWQISRLIYNRTIGVNNKSKVINEVIILSDELSGCREHAISRIPCSRLHCSVKSLKKICSYLESAQRTLDVCIYLLSSEDIARAVTRTFSRGVVVRVIVDASMADNSAFDRRVREFQEKGVRVRMKKSENLMHHKFAIIDREVILTGSTNWTMQALHGNWDNVIITNQRVFVEPFVKEFDRMWAELTKGED